MRYRTTITVVPTLTRPFEVPPALTLNVARPEPSETTMSLPSWSLSWDAHSWMPGA